MSCKILHKDIKTRKIKSSTKNLKKKTSDQKIKYLNLKISNFKQQVQILNKTCKDYSQYLPVSPAPFRCRLPATYFDPLGIRNWSVQLTIAF